METQVRRGRPSKGLSKLLQVWVTPEEYDLVKAYADATGETVAVVVRAELSSLLKRVDAIRRMAA